MRKPSDIPKGVWDTAVLFAGPASNTFIPHNTRVKIARAILNERNNAAKDYWALLQALEAAMAFIDSHVADPDITHEMHERYITLMNMNPHEVISQAIRNGGK